MASPAAGVATGPSPLVGMKRVAVPAALLAAALLCAAACASSDGTSAGVRPSGFSTVTARITGADGKVCEKCLWLADTAEERSRGLMGVTDLGAASGMAFVFDQPVTEQFYMFNTPTPLSISWFADNGSWVGATEMKPCLDRPAGQCSTYSPGRPYSLAVETFVGGLGDVQLGSGSAVELLAGTEGPQCQTPSSR
jgi:uncharacterized membrane protein (UPF0127 family)